MDPSQKPNLLGGYRLRHLDQKYASGSTVTLPVQAGIAKPAATYELKDQRSLQLMLRAQRNW